VRTCTTCGAEWPDDTRFCPSDGSSLKVAEGTSLIGGILDDKYHILEKLGEGGMGAVYLGEHVRMGRKSAIKVLTQSLAQDHEAIARFNREASSAARINHPNVCAIYDFGDTKDGLIYLAMEYIEGESLTDLLKREGPLGPYRAATIIRQAGSALQAAHHLGIVHRDLKPDNIMVTRTRDGSDVVKVVDFGIAKAISGDEGQKVTRTGLVVGTPEYMSPEQLSGDKLDGRSDTYSLALVLFQMLTGRLPFEADNAQEIMMKRLTDEPLQLNEALVGGSFPQKLQQVIEGALQRMPNDRYASVEEFTRDTVQAVSGGHTTPTVDTEGATQQLDMSRPDQQATEPLPSTRVSSSKPTLPLEESAAAATVTPDTPLPLTQHSPRDKKRSKKPVVVLAASLAVIAAGVGAAAVAFSGGAEQPARSGDTTQPARNTPTTPIDTGEGRSGDTQGGDSGETQTRPVGGEEVSSREQTGLDTTRRASSELSTPDLEALERELVDLGRQVLEPVTKESARTRLLEVFNDGALPDNLRGRAASIIAESYETENMTQACTWIERAINLDPDNEIFTMYKAVLRCTP
jgi:serine/threonine-protein kinase